MRRTLLVLALVAASIARADPPAALAMEPAQAAFADIAAVLQSPRCVNCHPSGDAPLQGDHQRVHAMGITRDIEGVGMSCQACHRERSVGPRDAPGMPPAAPHWSLPLKEMPLVFQGRTPAALCAQLKDPAHNGGRSLAQLLSHVTKDALVLYGFDPGGQRTVPPLTHERFVARVQEWIDAGAHCPQ